jgi:hypothetical protein
MRKQTSPRPLPPAESRPWLPLSPSDAKYVLDKLELIGKVPAATPKPKGVRR